MFPMLHGIVAQGGIPPVVYLVNEDFLTAATAPMATPRTSEPGPGTLTLVQTDGQMSIVTHRMNYPTQASAVTGDQGLRDIGRTRAAGLMLQSEFAWSTVGQHYLAFAASASVAYTAIDGYGWFVNNTPSLDVLNGAGAPVTLASLSGFTNINFTLSLVAQSTGALLFARYNDNALPTHALLWVDVNGATATIYPMFGNGAFGSAAGGMGSFLVRQIASGLFTDGTYYAINQSSPSGAYDATVADNLDAGSGIFDLVVTAPNPLSGSVELRFREQDANNYWTMYFNSSGQFRVDEVVAGVATNKISANSVITAGAARRMRCVANGTSLRFFTQSGAAWTARSTSTDGAGYAYNGVRVVATDFIANTLQVWAMRRVSYQRNLSPSKQMVCDGDSLTLGGGSTKGYTYPAQLQALMGGAATWGVGAVAAAGRLQSAMVTDAATKIDPMYDSQLTKNIVVHWGGINDVSASVSAATLYANIITYCQARQAAGWLVAVCTMPANGVVAGAKETVRLTVNTNIRANYATFADGLVDLADDARLQNSSDTTYYNVDTIHLNNNGYAVVAELAAVVVGAL